MDQIYSEPGEMDFGEVRFHDDIKNMSEGQLRDHFSRASLKLGMCKMPSVWLQERCLRLKEELEKRYGTA